MCPSNCTCFFFIDCLIVLHRDFKEKYDKQFRVASCRTEHFSKLIKGLLGDGLYPVLDFYF